MPEGPECYLYAKALAKTITEKKLVNVNVLSGRYLKKDIKGLDFVAGYMPLRVVGVGVHGKFIYWILDDAVFLFCSLGMTGSWTEKKTEHSRVEFCFSDQTKVYFTDIRGFGTLSFTKGKSKLISKLESLGPDMLRDVSDDEFLYSLRMFDTKEISKVLMTQEAVAGVGNYIKCDALWDARIKPTKLVQELSDLQIYDLKISIQKLMQESIRNLGSPSTSYTNFNGDIGTYSFKVYKQKEDKFGNVVEKVKTKDGRNTHWVQAIQK